MSTTKAKDLRNLSEAELEQKKKALAKELYELKQKKGMGTLDKPHQFKEIRHTVARIETIKREKKNAS